MEIPYRDMNVSYTKHELENVLPAIFRSMPTYNPDDDSILTPDFGELYRRSGYKRTPEQVKVDTDYFDQNHNGRAYMHQYITVFAELHKPTAMVRSFIMTVVDRDGNGYISAEEFVEMMKVIDNYDPRLVGKTYDLFVMEADTNKDGQVDIDECVAWVDKYTSGGKIPFK